MKLNILIPMAGLGKRFSDVGYKEHKPLIDVAGVPMIKRVIDNLTPQRSDYAFHFVCIAQHTDDRLLDILKATQFGSIIVLPGLTEGAAVTCLKATEFIDNDDPLIIASCDQLIDWSVDDYVDASDGLDASIVTYKTVHPMHSFYRSENGKVVEAAEKVPICDDGGVGVFYFGKGHFFVEAARQMIAKNIRYNNEFYYGPSINEMIDLGYRNIEIYDIPPSTSHVIGTPETLEAYLRGE